MPRWRIYYGSGATFSDADGPPASAPPFDVCAIVYADEEVGRVVLHRWDWYFVRAGEWWGADIFGLLDQLLHDRAGEVGAVKQGRTVSNEAYRAALARALADPDFPAKNAVRAGERG